MLLTVPTLTKLVGPDLVVLALAFLVLFGIPALVAVPIIFVINRRRKKPPPVPASLEHTHK